MQRSGVYCVRNIDNNKRYTGSSKDIKLRMRIHRSRLRINKHHSPYLQSALNQSPDSFVFEIVEEIRERWAKLGQREQQRERMKTICNTEHHRWRLSDGQKLRFSDPEERR